ncbi:MAG: MerR family transcriptional regulator [Nocardia sp.]|nr:MerR family transcriptional regulator [Nocardia sp.]
MRTLQYYDRIELLVAERDESGRRRYGPEKLDRLRRIQLLTSAGLRLDESARRCTGRPACRWSRPTANRFGCSRSRSCGCGAGGRCWPR